MTDNERFYRQSLSSHGRIFLAGEELGIKIKNLSITGMLVVLEDNVFIDNVNDVFEAIKFSSIIDFYLPDMRLQGEAALVRVDLVEEEILLALEFSNLSYNVENVLYKRKAYRKNMTAPGQIVLSDITYHFVTKNASQDGLLVFLKESINVKPGTNAIFEFRRLKLRGVVKVMWVENSEEGGTLLGLHYEQLEKKHIDDIPRFEPNFNSFK